MTLDRPHAEEKGGGDGRGRLARDDQREDIALARRQAVLASQRPRSPEAVEIDAVGPIATADRIGPAQPPPAL